MADRFHYWCGASGRRYLFTAVPAESLGDFCHAIAVLAAPDGTGALSGRAVSLVETPGDALSLAAALTADPRLVAFVHLLAPTAGEREAVLDDLLGRRAGIAA